MSAIKVGQVYASTHSGDIEYGRRQRRHVVDVRLNDARPCVWLQTEGGFLMSQPSCVHLRSPRARTIPGHRLVEDVAA